VPFAPAEHDAVIYPLIRCIEEIPCNPCIDSCPKQSIKIPGDSIMGLPVFDGECIACTKCVSVCPGLAINLIQPDFDGGRETSLLIIPFELDSGDLFAGRRVETVDMNGNPVGEGEIVAFRKSPLDEKRLLVSVEVPRSQAFDVAGFTVLEAEEGEWGGGIAEPVTDDTIVCRCERITAGEVRAEIRSGVYDMNILKATIRTGMGACGGKTCTELILRLYREEGIDLSLVTLPTGRPFVSEVPLAAFAGVDGGDTCDS
jgi:ferredoxin